MKKRTAAIFLTLALCLTLLPTAALAAEGDTVVVKPEIEYGGDYINCTTDTVIDVSDVSSAGTIYVTVKNEGCTITLTGPDFPAGARAGGGGGLAQHGRVLPHRDYHHARGRREREQRRDL